MLIVRPVLQYGKNMSRCHSQGRWIGSGLAPRLVILGAIWLWPSVGWGQTLEETVNFLSEFIGKQAVIKAPSCRPEDGDRLTLVTEAYATIPTGTNLGLIELNHGTPSARIGRTLFDLHDVLRIEAGGEERIDQSRTYQSVRVMCRGAAACIDKLTYCDGDIRERRTQVRTDALYFRGASSAERVVKALTHLQDLITAKDKASPF